MFRLNEYKTTRRSLSNSNQDVTEITLRTKTIIASVTEMLLTYCFVNVVRKSM